MEMEFEKGWIGIKKFWIGIGIEASYKTLNPEINLPYHYWLL